MTMKKHLLAALLPLVVAGCAVPPEPPDARSEDAALRDAPLGIDAAREPVADAALEPPDVGTDVGQYAQVIASDAWARDTSMRDAATTDSGPSGGGACDPYRSGTSRVSSADCDGMSTPICDAVTRMCVEPRVGVPCGACRTDADCAGTSPPSQCVAIDRGGSGGPDFACAVPCDPTIPSACRVEMTSYGWLMNCLVAAHLDTASGGNYCLKAASAADGSGGCRRSAGARLGPLP